MYIYVYVYIYICKSIYLFIHTQNFKIICACEGTRLRACRAPDVELRTVSLSYIRTRTDMRHCHRYWRVWSLCASPSHTHTQI